MESTSLFVHSPWHKECIGMCVRQGFDDLMTKCARCGVCSLIHHHTFVIFGNGASLSSEAITVLFSRDWQKLVFNPRHFMLTIVLIFMHDENVIIRKGENHTSFLDVGVQPLMWGVLLSVSLINYHSSSQPGGQLLCFTSGAHVGTSMLAWLLKPNLTITFKLEK